MMNNTSMLIIFLISLWLIEAQMVPSFGVTSCTNSEPCTSKLMVTVYIQDVSNGNFQLNVVIPESTVLTDTATGESFQVARPIAINVQWSNIYFEYSMINKGTRFQSAYEYDYISAPIRPCPSSTMCCSQGSNYLYKSFQLDSTSYQAYSVPQTPVFQYSVAITASQGSLNKSIYLNPNTQIVSDSTTGIRASMLAVDVDLASLPDISATQLYMVNPSIPSTHFMVPTTAFCGASASASNCVGMTSSSFLYNTRCTSPIGTFTQISGSLASDQWSQWRTVSLQSALQPTCVSTSQSMTSSGPQEIMQCAVSKSARVLLELYASSFQIVRLYGIPQVLSSGALMVMPSDTQLTLFVDVTNVGNHQGVFQFQINACCVRGFTCTTLNLIQFQTLAQFGTFRYSFKLQTPNGKLYGISGSCDLTVLQLGEISLQTNFVFNSTNAPPAASQTSVIGNSIATTLSNPSSTCPLPNRLQRSGNTLYCLAPCTIDQVLDSNTNICNPVNCVTKYSGQRNVFSAAVFLCQPKPMCAANQIYIPANNLCAASNSTAVTPITTPPIASAVDPDLAGVLPVDDTSASNSDSNEAPVVTVPTLAPIVTAGGGIADGSTIKAINCTSRGHLDSTNMTCTCDAGWKNAYDGATLTIQWCSVPTVYANASLSVRSVDAKSVIMIGGLSMGLCCALSILFACCKWFAGNTKNEVKQKVKAEKLTQTQCKLKNQEQSLVESSTIDQTITYMHRNTLFKEEAELSDVKKNMDAAETIRVSIEIP